MHILIIPSWYKDKENPVLGSFFEEQARSLMRRGHKVGLLYPQFIPFISHKTGGKQIWDDDGLPTFECSVKATIPRSRWFNYLYLCKAVYQFYQEYTSKYGKPDIIHSHSVFYGAIVGNYISQKDNIPIIHTEHLTSFLNKLIPSKDLVFAKKVFEQVNINLVVSKSFIDELPAYIGVSEKRYSVVHNVVDPAFINGFLPHAYNAEDIFRFCTISYLTERKNHSLMIKAFAVFLEQFPNSELVIGGEDVPLGSGMKVKLQKLTSELGISDKVIFLGALSRQEVLREMQKCHVFLMGSLYETFGVVLIEAMAVGRPVISTNSKGPEDIVHSLNGLIVDSWEVGDFAKAMLYVAKHYDSFNQAAISHDVTSRFGEDRIMSQIEGWYEWAIAGNKAPNV